MTPAGRDAIIAACRPMRARLAALRAARQPASNVVLFPRRPSNPLLQPGGAA